MRMAGTGTAMLLIGAMLVGCAPRGTKPATKASSGALTTTDPCGMRLHDICGPLLLYYATRHRLPDSLEMLNEIPHDETLDFTCPVTQQPYVYDPSGLLNSSNGRLIVFDPTPAH